jgi:hypothetical protein
VNVDEDVVRVLRGRVEGEDIANGDAGDGE